jgi:hypothetical protein
MQVTDDACGVPKREEVVVVGETVANGRDLAVHVGNRTEPHDRLIDEMAAEVEQLAAALVRRRRPPRARVGIGSPALESRLVAEHCAQPILGEHALERELIRIPPAVLKYGQQSPGALRVEHHRLCVASG